MRLQLGYLVFGKPKVEQYLGGSFEVLVSLT
jgi:hypothetical protein